MTFVFLVFAAAAVATPALPAVTSGSATGSDEEVDDPDRGADHARVDVLAVQRQGVDDLHRGGFETSSSVSTEVWETGRNIAAGCAGSGVSQ